jgi:dodecin
VPDSVFKKIELVGCSPNNISEAIENAVQTASGSVKNLAWFEVEEVRGNIQGGKVSQYQVVIKAGFKIEK